MPLKPSDLIIAYVESNIDNATTPKSLHVSEALVHEANFINIWCLRFTYMDHNFYHLQDPTQYSLFIDIVDRFLFQI